MIKELEGKSVAVVAMGQSQIDFHLSQVHSAFFDEVWFYKSNGIL